LRAALEVVLVPHRIRALRRRPCDYRSSFTLDELGVQLDDGTRLRLMFKDLGRRGLVGRAVHAKPAFLHDPLREIEMYRSVLPVAALGTAGCFGALVDRLAGYYWLFLEKVEGWELYQVGSLDVWCGVARWLARLHLRFQHAPEEQCGPAARHLLRYDHDFYWTWPRRAQRFLADASLAAATRQPFERLLDQYGAVVDRLLALPGTLIHGEFYAPNILTREKVDGLRVCPIDWEMAALGPGPMDLAALTAGEWTDADRDAMIWAYHDELVRQGGPAPAPEDLRAALDFCRLHLAVQWLGWSPRHVPPPANSPDWLGEALHLAERLGLN
jgi:hypothetical protein